MTTILLARHGQSDWNAARRWQGHADRPLTELGRAQAAALAERLGEIDLDAVYSSDLRRAYETAKAVADSKGLKVRTSRDLREVDVGSWSGLTLEEARERFTQGYERWVVGEPGWTDGETYEEMAERVLGAVWRIIRAHAGGTALVVSHGGPIRAIHAAALGLHIHAYRQLRPVEPNARLSAVCAEDGRITEVCAAPEISRLVARDAAGRTELAYRPPSPRG